MVQELSLMQDKTQQSPVLLKPCEKVDQGTSDQLFPNLILVKFTKIQVIGDLYKSNFSRVVDFSS